MSETVEKTIIFSMNETLYSVFKDCLSTQDFSLLEQLKDREFWGGLLLEERERLARLFLAKAETISLHSKEENWNENELLEVCRCIDSLMPQHVELSCRQAFLFLKTSLNQAKGSFALLALEKISGAYAIDPSFFEASYTWFHLWGTILLALYQFTSTDHLVERALKKFENSERILNKTVSHNLGARDLYWDWADAWLRLGKLSKEPSDFYQALDKFRRAIQWGTDAPLLRIDTAEAFFELASILGDPALMRAAVEAFEEGISSSVPVELSDPLPISYHKGWKLLTKAAAKCAELSGIKEDFEKASLLFQEAILATPTQASLWYDWGALLITQGWMEKNCKPLEDALEKLTSSKISECEPFKVTALQGEVLVLLGLYLDDFKLLKEGRSRIQLVKKWGKEQEIATFLGISDLAWGLYFSDETSFSRAVQHFQQALRETPNCVKTLRALFQAYLAWGLNTHNDWLIQKGLSIVQKLSEMHPYCPLYFTYWGYAYFRLSQIEKPDGQVLKMAIEKFQHAIDLLDAHEQDKTDCLFFLGCAYDLLGDVSGDETYYLKAIDSFSDVLEKSPYAINVRFQLAVSLSHLGELTGQPEFLFQADELFQSLLKSEEEEDSFWCEWGYCLLILSELVNDPHLPDESHRLKKAASTKFAKGIELGNGPAAYHLACLHSLNDEFDKALFFLDVAHRWDALPPLEELEEEEWLTKLRDTKGYQTFITEFKQRELEL